MGVYKTTYDHGDYVYLKTDAEQDRRIITSIWIKPSGVLYELSCGSLTSDHYEFEISSTPDHSIRLGINEEVNR